MRLSCFYFLVTTFLITTACSDPQCQSDELKVGTICRQIHALPDGSTDAPDGLQGRDASTTDAKSDAADAAQPGSTSDASLAADPDAVLDDLPGGPPSFQFRADTVTMNGANVAAIPNRRSSDTLIVAAGQLAAPARDMLFGGAPSLAFTGTQWLDSSLPPDAWKFLHDGTGCEVLVVWAPTELAAGTQVVWSTSDLTAVGAAHYYFSNSNLIAAGSNSTSTGSLSAPKSLVEGVPLYSTYTSSLAAPVFAQMFVRDAALSTVITPAVTPSSASPAATFRLGARTDGSFAARMRWSEVLIFPRVLHEYERQLVREYIAARYGFAAPTLAGPDRELMSLLPFAWLDAEAHTAADGKVVNFVDRARPGHVLASPSANLQAKVPTKSPDFNGRMAVDTTGAGASYDSNLPAAAWTFMHNGSGAEWIHLSKQTATATSRLLGDAALRTHSGIINQMSATGDALFTVVNGTSIAVSGSLPGGSPINSAVALFYSLAKDAWSITNSNGATVTGVPGALSSANPPATMRLLGLAAATGDEWQGQWASTLIFNRVLSAKERAKRAAALTAKYGRGL